ncbi:2-hydroxyacid dehydrogenase [Janibacter sp. YIM B02568]|uniref:2-hydroxyacid dehydrogenase n=1 Tax=Janibacter endophyticus TaxID=2806261 RepID=UPI00194FA93D|nr:2-hydroxyacid dehydrogenase [Janibacter endophyticus]MBM6545851.1 2-hydroxyacid dehydrogenase [Janibacter endophyticus]
MALVASFPDEQWLDAVGPVDGVTSVVWAPEGPVPEEDVDVYVAPYMGGPDQVAVVAEKPSVRLVQLLSAGYHNVVPVLPEGVALANAAGVHDDSTAELAVGLALASLRGIDDAARDMTKGEWPGRRVRRSLADSRVLVVGYGSIGRAIARRLGSFEVSLTAVASRARGGDDLVERVHGIDELPGLLPDHDVVVLVVPLTDDTRHLVDDDFLSALADGSLVVNVARGPVVDTDAMLRHAGRLSFALDVTDPEPLPADHPLWSAPGVLVTPHVGGVTTAFRPRAVRLLRRQLEALVGGGDPLNVVHPA